MWPISEHVQRRRIYTFMNLLAVVANNHIIAISAIQPDCWKLALEEIRTATSKASAPAIINIRCCET